MSDDLIYQIALTRIPQIGDVHARLLFNYFGSAGAIFNSPRSRLEKLEGIGTVRAGHIKSFRDFSSCEKEALLLERSGTLPLFFTDNRYPQRLLHCQDAPVMIYFKGNADLNAARMVGVVGTRNITDYGRMACSQLIAGLREHGVTIVSGLAYGIDTIAHRSALEHGLPTLAAMAHGLDIVYPWANKNLAERMLTQGGLLSDLPHGTKPDRQHFPRRNRIVAGLSDALVVVQSGITGGSLITASLADSYHRDVFALPGRIDDEKSKGCHALIRDHKAELITDAADLICKMGWDLKQAVRSQSQRSIFPELTEDEICVTGQLNRQEMDIDELQLKSGLTPGRLAAALLSLEIKTVIKPLPGKRFRLL
jgi:DNA processing protein